MEKGKRYHPKYERPGRTKQEFAKSCDVNWILERAQEQGSLSHLEKHGAQFGDFADAPKDLFEARALLDRGKEIFLDAPAEVRKEFDNDPLKYFAFVNDPKNADRLEEVLPQIAQPGRYFLDVSPSTPPGSTLQVRAAPSEPAKAGSQGSEATDTTASAAIEPEKGSHEPSQDTG